MEQERNVLDILLDMEPPRPRTAKVKMKQLSEHAGKEVVFEIRELAYNRVREIQKLESGERGNVTAAIVLAGVTQPNLRDDKLLAKYSAPSPQELLGKMLSAGEIAELSERIERLSGYRESVTELVEDVKKN